MSRILGHFSRQRFATSGHEALRLAREQRPDLIVVDADMPGMSGLEVCSAVRADALLARVPVIFASSHQDAELEVAALEQGADDFIAKPLVPSQLVARADARLRASRLIEELKLDHRAVFAAERHTPLRTPRLLIVDDDVVAIRVLQRSLADLGEIHFARSADSALRVAAHVRPDLVVLDVHMPDADGMELCARLRAAAGVQKHLPIIFVTRFSDPRVELKALTLGAADFASKACRPAVLRARVSRLLALKCRTDDELFSIGDAWRRLGGTLAATLFGQCSDAIVAADAQGRIALVNAAASRLFGLPIESLTGLPLARLAGQDLAGVERSIAEGRPLLLRRADGSAFNATVSLSPSLSGGAPDGLATLMFHDLSEQEGRVAEAAAHTAAQAKHRTTALTLSCLAHEVGNPLHAILGFAELMQQDGAHPLDPVQARRLDHVVASGRHLRDLLADVANVSRLEFGNLPIRLQTVDARRVAAEVIASVADLASGAGVAVRLAGPDTAPVRADPVRLHQVLLNLLTNAVKYGQSGGTVDVELVGTPDTVRIDVADHGPGLTAEQCQHLFEPFNRLGHQRGGVQGTGLGLVIARQLVHAMNGQITVTSQPGQGSRFSVTLPPGPPATPNPATE